MTNALNSIIEISLKKNEEIPLSLIDPEPALDWFMDPPDELSQKALLLHAVMTPLIVQARPKQRFRLVDGYRRMRILQQQSAKKEKLHCHVLPPDLPLSKVFLFRLRLQPVSKLATLPGVRSCVLLKQMHQAGMNVKELAREVLPPLGEQASVRVANRMLQLAQALESFTLPESLRKLSVADLLPMLKFPTHLLPDVVELAGKMNLGSNKWKTLLQLLDEVCRFRQDDAGAILDSPEIRAILDHPDLQGPVRYRKLKQQLERLRYPELTEQRFRFAEILARLRLPAGVEIEADQFFERDALTLKIDAGSLAELKQKINGMEMHLNDAALQEIFQVAREG